MGDTSLSGLYILNGKTPVPVGSIEEWSKSFFPGRSTLAREYVGDTYVSTIFLGADYSFGGRPLFFETLVDKGDDFYTVKYSEHRTSVSRHILRCKCQTKCGGQKAHWITGWFYGGYH